MANHLYLEYNPYWGYEMSNIQESVKLGSNTFNVMTSLITVISELDWILLERGERSLVFREKRRFDHFSHIEGRLEISDNGEDREIILDISNSGIGSVQEKYLRGKVSEFLLLLKYQIDMEQEVEDDESRSISRDIENLSILHREGELSDDEFRRAKTKLLNN